MKKNKKRKQKDFVGGILAIIVFILLVIVGIFIGRYIAVKMTGEEVNLQNMFTIIKLENNKVESPIKEVLNDGVMTIEDLCDMDTGLCDKNVGYLKIDDKKYVLGITYDFDSLENDKYFKLNDKKIGNFSIINNFAKLDNYLVLSEPEDGSTTYHIHIYNMDGLQKEDIIAFYNNIEFVLNLDGNINYYTCEKNCSNDESDCLDTIKYMELSIDDNNIITKEISKEYGSC